VGSRGELEVLGTPSGNPEALTLCFRVEAEAKPSVARQPLWTKSALASRLPMPSTTPCRVVPVNGLTRLDHAHLDAWRCWGGLRDQQRPAAQPITLAPDTACGAEVPVAGCGAGFDDALQECVAGSGCMVRSSRRGVVRSLLRDEKGRLLRWSRAGLRGQDPDQRYRAERRQQCQPSPHVRSISPGRSTVNVGSLTSDEECYPRTCSSAGVPEPLIQEGAAARGPTSRPARLPRPSGAALAR
jgi:hypothetical protein